MPEPIPTVFVAPRDILPPTGVVEAVDADGSITSTQDSLRTTPRPPAKFLGYELPGVVSDVAYAVQDFGRRMRRKTIEASPNIIANNSSNIIGFMQLIAEGFMFKSGGFSIWAKLVDGKEIKPQKITDFITFPFNNIFYAIFNRAKFTVSLSDLTNPSFYSDAWKRLKDLETASHIDSANGTVKLTNRWSARSGFAGIVSMTAAAILPDEKETPEEVERNARLAQHRPFYYVASRLVQGIWFPAETAIKIVDKVFHPNKDCDIGKHKRQFAGLGMLLTGILSFISGFRQVEGKIVGQQKYMRNPWQMCGGLITALAGSQLSLGIDSEQGWSRFGGIQIGRLLTLPGSIKGRFDGNEQGAHWYLGAQSILQVKNVLAVLLGGAEKRADGTIVDHVEIRKKAKEKARLLTATGTYGVPYFNKDADTPPTTINAATADRAKASSHEKDAEQPLRA